MRKALDIQTLFWLDEHSLTLVNTIGTHNPPSINIANTDSFWLVFICSRQMTVHGNVKVMTSRMSSVHANPRYMANL